MNASAAAKSLTIQTVPPRSISNHSHKQVLHLADKSLPFIDHWVLNIEDVPPEFINDENRFMARFRDFCDYLHLTRVNDFCHYFGPGLSAVIIVSESHIAAHTWPELGYMHVDLVTCGGGVVNKASLGAACEKFWSVRVANIENVNLKKGK